MFVVVPDTNDWYWKWALAIIVDKEVVSHPYVDVEVHRLPC
jgi:hypothetical protein